ncbi:MAG TPA: methyltransferase domain-containing protein [Opitutaceae bacterium]|nr:methyltransferase domain-containing protein [Opitutaceae bacterium]
MAAAATRQAGPGAGHDEALYYRHAGRSRLVQAVSLRTRLSVVRRFGELLRPGPDTTILDVGVSLETARIEANVLEQIHPHRGRITCAGIGPGAAVTAGYPGVSYVPISPHAPLPFPEGHFDIAYSNAVIEHVGSRQAQARFVAELCRVGRRVFLATPNRWFPIEHHTGLPLLHYLPLGVFRALLRRTRLRHWSDPDNLNPLTGAELRGLFPRPDRVRIELAGTGLGPLRSNLIAWA